ncbi:MAG: 50S ribosomal protein L25 [Calditrichaeota bacterium]|nr:MAG: 50S ribosomal protein L25 [Calditrichota bacterium]
MSEITLNVVTRAGIGTQAVKKIRRDEKVPGIFYHHGKENVAFMIDRQLLRTIRGHKSALLDVVFDGKDHKKCVIREIQFDPITNRPIHLDLMGIKMTEKIRVSVHISLTGTPEGVRVSGGTLQQVLREADIECLPSDIPEIIELDVTALNVAESLSLGDIHIDKVIVLGDPDTVIATVAVPRVEAPAEPAEPAEEAASAEPEVITRKAKEETEE